MSCRGARFFWTLGLLLASVTAAAQTTWVVTTDVEPAGGINSASCSTTCTLRDAVNQSASGDTIRFDPSLSSTTIALTLYSNDPGCITTAPTTCSSGTLGTEFGPSAFFITGNKTLTIDGITGLTQGITITRASATKFRLFDVDAGSSLTLIGVTLSNGYAQGGNSNLGGGGLGAGGAVFNQGTLTIDRSTFLQNTAHGGNSGDPNSGSGGGGAGLNAPNDGTGDGGGPNGGLSFSTSPFSAATGDHGGAGGGGGMGGAAGGNGGSGGFGGGGAAGDGGALSAGGNGGFGGGGGANSVGGATGAGGQAGFGGGDVRFDGDIGGGGGGMGGAIFNDAGTVSITNSTFYTNSAVFGAGPINGAGYGGALFNYDGTMDLLFVTAIANNASNDGLQMYSYADTSGFGLQLVNTIAATLVSTPEHDVVIGGMSGSGGVGDLITSQLGFSGSVVTTVAPTGGFGYGGGPIQTFTPTPTSSNVDQVSCGAPIDQRGIPRPQGALCDIGAVELVEPCYVNVAAVGGDDGTSWANAFNDLQLALTPSSTCLDVWVARGVYKPTTTTDQTISFKITPGMTVYGGFAGTESQLVDRDPVNNVTVLSGDIDNNDAHAANTNIDVTYNDIQGLNTYNVVLMDGTTGLGHITASTVLDGFTITGGAANGTNYPNTEGGGLHCSGQFGGDCSPTLANIVFSGNLAVSGGGIFNDGYSGSSSPTLSNVTFSGNAAPGAGQTGGAMYNFGESTGVSSPVLSNVTFSDNTAYLGGAIVNDGYGGTSSPTFINATFSGNTATFGAGIYNTGDGGGVSNPKLSFVTFNGNNASACGGALENYGNSNARFDHAILWSDAGTEICNAVGGTATVVNSDVQGSGGSAAWNPSFGADGGNNLDADPLLGALKNYGGPTKTLMPGVGSAALDAATDCNDADSNVVAADQRGEARPQGSACDLGAVEASAIDLDRIFANGFQ
jgi:hypothetical protein